MSLDTKDISLNKEERNLIYTQIGARAQYFEAEVKKAAATGDMRRVREVIKVLDVIKEIQNKMLV